MAEARARRARQEAPRRARTKRIVITEKSNIIEKPLSSPLPHEHAPSTHRGGFSIYRAVFAHWDAAFQRFGLQRFVLNTSHVIPKKTWSLPCLGLRATVGGLLEHVLEIGAPREPPWRCLAASDGASWLDCASHFDVTSFDVNILAPFGADSRTSRTARRMARDLLCAALSLPGCEQSSRTLRAAAAALGVCRAS